jgi:hypothetical protein
MKTAVEMTGHGRRGKPKAGFPPRPQPLEIAKNAIPTFPQPRRGAEKWKTKSTFPTFPLTVLVFVSKTQKGGLAADRFAPAPGSFFDEKMLLHLIHEASGIG